MPHLPLTAIPSDLASFLAAVPLTDLGPGIVDMEFADRLRTWSIAPASIQNQDAARACQAGLWLLANDLGASHRISQELATPEGSAWHGIMHRREGDFRNAKYWFRRAGRLPLFENGWDAMAFVNAVEAFVERGVGDGDQLRNQQRREWITLFRHCLEQALRR